MIESNRKLLQILFLLISCSSFIHATPVYELAWGPKCSGNMELDIEYLTCDSNGDGVCAAGENAYTYGSLTLGDYGLYGSSMTNRVCLWGVDLDMFCQDMDVEADFCSIFFEAFNADENGNQCPSQANAGPYSFEKEFTLPSGINIGMNYWVVIQTTLTNDDGSAYTCETRVNVSDNGNNTSTARFVGMCFLSIGALGSLLFVRKRRMMAKINLVQEEELAASSPDAQGHFEMMEDRGIV